MGADTLSEVLKTVRLTGAIFFDVDVQAPWVAEQPPRNLIMDMILPGAQHLIAYHAVTEGRCFASLVGADPIAVEAGEVIVLTNADPHVVSSSPGLRATVSAQSAIEAAAAGQLPCMVTNGGDGAPVKLVCGYLACDARPFNPLLENLPAVIKAGHPERGAPSRLGQFARVVTAEAASRRPGSEGVLARLSELMFIEVIRQHLEDAPAGASGWLAGLRDPFIGKSLSLLHAAPTRDWTVEDLARQVGMSRSVFSERFTALVGLPPMQYLTKWRMQIAWGLLRTGNVTVATVAAEAGYGSEAAFSRAFKKMVGLPPVAVRRHVAFPDTKASGVEVPVS